jgi:hypothetical protein
MKGRRAGLDLKKFRKSREPKSAKEQLAECQRREAERKAQEQILVAQQATQARKAEEEARVTAIKERIDRANAACEAALCVVKPTFKEPLIRNLVDAGRLLMVLATTFKGKLAFSTRVEGALEHGSADHENLVLYAEPIFRPFEYAPGSSDGFHYPPPIAERAEKAAQEYTSYWPTHDYVEAFAKGYNQALRDDLSTDPRGVRRLGPWFMRGMG